MRNDRILEATTEFMRKEEEREKEAREAGQEHEVKMCRPPTKLSEIKQPFYEDLATAMKEMSTPAMQKSLHEKAWCNGLFKKCYDLNFQRKAVALVGEDMQAGTGKCFKNSPTSLPVDPTQVSEPDLVMQVGDAAAEAEQATPESDSASR